MVSILALIPISTHAQSSAPAAPASGPLIAHSTGATPQFLFIAGPNRSDVAWSTGGDVLVSDIGLQDPSEQVSLGVANALAKRKGGQVIEGAVAGGRATFTVKVETTEWSAGYYLAGRPTYSVKFYARLTITDAAGAVVKTATCSVAPDDSSSAGGNDVFLAHKGKLLKSTFAKAAQECQGELISKTKSL
jgi:hypothetical protein